MRKSILLLVLAVSLTSCDVFLEDWGAKGKICETTDDCQDGLLCTGGHICGSDDFYCEDTSHCTWINAQAYCDFEMNECEDGFGLDCSEDSGVCADFLEYPECQYFTTEEAGGEDKGYCTEACDSPDDCGGDPARRRCTMTRGGCLACAEPAWSKGWGNLCQNEQCSEEAECVTSPDGFYDLCLAPCPENKCLTDQLCEVLPGESQTFCFYAEWYGFGNCCDGENPCGVVFDICDDSGTDGYCTRICSTGDDCPPESECLTVNAQDICVISE